MGNNVSDNENINYKNMSLGQKIDVIATYYILTSNFKSLKNLTEKEYCDNLIILTADIISKYLTDMEINYVTYKIKNGVEVNEMDKQKTIFFNKNDIEEFNQNPLKKKRMCLGIAKFYIKIAHLFSAIVMTINPTYKYKDETGNNVVVGFSEKDKIPINTPRIITRMNICNNRIDSLTQNNSFIDASNNKITISPKICMINTDKYGNINSLLDEPGMKELEQLYYDKYDYLTGEFSEMKPETKKVFQNNLKEFYIAFTGNTYMPEYIKSFKDIKLEDYQSSKICKGKISEFNQTVDNPSFSFFPNLFSSYANHIKNMIETTKKNQEELLGVIDALFVYSKNPTTNKTHIRINPSLTEELLQKIVNDTRKLIIKLYINCEKDYAKGINLFQTIIEDRIAQTTKNQITELNKKSLEIFSSPPKYSEPVALPEIKPNEPVASPEIKPNEPVASPEIKPNEPVAIASPEIKPNEQIGLPRI
jgi:hypothetical protein